MKTTNAPVQTPLLKIPELFTSISLKNGNKHIGKIHLDIFQKILNLSYLNSERKDIKEILENKTATLKQIYKIASDARIPVPFFLLDSDDCIDKHYEKFFKDIGLGAIVNNHHYRVGARERKLLQEQKYIIHKIASELVVKQCYYSKSGEAKAAHPVLPSITVSNIEKMAKEVRDFYGIDLGIIRKQENMTQTREYLINLLEDKSIFVSLGTNANGVMPVKTKDKVIGAFWLPNRYESDKPWIFVDTKDDIDKYKDPTGRQIYSIVLMLVFFLYDRKNVYFNKHGEAIEKGHPDYKFHLLASEILLPASEMKKISNIGFEFIKNNFRKYGVTPTCLARRFFTIGRINRVQHNMLRGEIKSSIPESFARPNKKTLSLNWTKAQLRFTNKKFANTVIKNESKLGGRNRVSKAIFGKILGNGKYNERIGKIREVQKL